MTTSSTTTSGGSFGVVDVLAILVGLAVFGYGLLLVPTSLLGGAWVAGIGLSLALAGLFATEWVGRRVGLSAADRRTLTLTFAGVAGFLFVSFVVVNYAGFSGPVVESGSQTGSN